MEPCVQLDVPPQPGSGPRVAVLVVVLVVITVATRVGYPVPDVAIYAVISAILSAAGIQAVRQVPVLIADRGDG